MKATGVSLKVAAFSVALVGLAALALHGDVLSASYKENKWCLACHKRSHGGIIAAWQKSAHANTFWKVGQEKEGQTIVAQFGAEAPFSRDKVAYVIGSGLRRQAYLDAALKVLPGEWESAQKTWKPIPQAEGASECLGCHVSAYNAADKTWLEEGVTCQMCHGPGSEHMGAADKKASIVRPATLPAQLRAAICGQCHSVGRDPTGKFAFPVGFRPGQDLAAKFVDGKPSAHAPQQQYSELLQSPGHWAAGVVCDTCHDSHGASALPHQLKKPVNDLCLDCHKDKITGAQHSPESLARQTCAACHLPEGSHFFCKGQK